MRNLLSISTLIFLLYTPILYKAQDSGQLSLGLRTTSSLFGADKSQVGFGTGGQFRLRLGQKLNTEWFADLLKNSIGNLGTRTDGHIGWSVMFYPLENQSKNATYLLAGHCFDYTKVDAFGSEIHLPSSALRWSSAVQAGIGNSFIISDRFDLSLSAQYMVHLGKDIHTDTHLDNGIEIMHVSETSHRGLEGHLLITFSINFNLVDLW